VSETNLQAQLAYMCEEIAAALKLPVQTPAGTVQSVRDLARLAEGWDTCPTCKGSAEVAAAPPHTLQRQTEGD
jgi:hypothetical protein